ncbi:MAG: hypothetical protein WC378_13565 [Opitutaceae bacterium]|jgi:hypothetical protein
MKKMFLIVAILAMCLPGFAGEDATGLEYLDLCELVVFTNGAANYWPVSTDGVVQAGTDISAYHGNAKIIVISGDNLSVNAISNMNVVLQHAIAATGTYSTVSASVLAPFTLASTGQVQKANVDLDALHKYVRVLGTLQGTNTTISKSISVLMVTPHLSD